MRDINIAGTDVNPYEIQTSDENYDLVINTYGTPATAWAEYERLKKTGGFREIQLSLVLAKAESEDNGEANP